MQGRRKCLTKCANESARWTKEELTHMRVTPRPLNDVSIISDSMDLYRHHSLPFGLSISQLDYEVKISI